MVRKVLVFFMICLAAESLQARKQIVVDLSRQEAFAYEDGVLRFSGWISTGRPGRRTPTGHFRVLEKDIDHVSSRYPEPNGGAEMHYMLRLTDYGVAMHLGYVPNYPASHGCIRLENGFAQKMYYWADIGTPVLIRGYPPRRIDRPIARTASRIVSSGNSDWNRIFTGNDPLKLLSTIPGKKESAGSGRNPPKKKMRSDRKRYIATGVEKKPVSPLAMLKE